MDFIFELALWLIPTFALLAVLVKKELATKTSLFMIAAANALLLVLSLTQNSALASKYRETCERYLETQNLESGYYHRTVSACLDERVRRIDQ